MTRCVFSVCAICRGNSGKSTHLCNQDTFGGPQGVHITQVPMDIHTLKYD